MADWQREDSTRFRIPPKAHTMPAEKVFWLDPYLAELDARVTGVDGDVVTLDRTILFAESGGPGSDAGTIDGLPVLSATRRGLEIEYSLPASHGLNVDDPVRVAIDWPRRFALMRLHFAAELALELVTRTLPEARKVGANISADKARIDFAMETSIAPVLPAIAEEIARLVDADLEIVSAFSDEVAERRYWEIAGFASVACGGTHPRSTGEVGRIALKRENPGRGKERTEIRLAD